MTLQLAYVELYWDYHHGRTSCTSKNIDGQYMIIYTIEQGEFYNKFYVAYKDIALDSQKESLNSWNEKFVCDINHKIRNFEKIYGNKDHQNLEIVQMIELPGLEQVAIIKTFWLKVLQRRFKNYFKKKLV